MEIMHFNSTKERLDYLHDNFNEIVPKEVKEESKEEKRNKSSVALQSVSVSSIDSVIVSNVTVA